MHFNVFVSTPACVERYAMFYIYKMRARVRVLYGKLNDIYTVPVEAWVRIRAGAPANLSPGSLGL